MKIKRTSLFTGEENVMELDVTYEQLVAWRRGGLVQNVFPNLNADEREFLISGSLPGEYDEVIENVFGPEEEEGVFNG
jgi:hypothetical protein